MNYEGLTKAILEGIEKDKPRVAETAIQRVERISLVGDCIIHNPWGKNNFNLTKQVQLENIAPSVAASLKELAPDEGTPDYPEAVRKVFGVYIDDKGATDDGAKAD